MYNADLEAWHVELRILVMKIQSSTGDIKTQRTIHPSIRLWLDQNEIEFFIGDSGVYVYNEDDAVKLKLALPNL